jgi:hypothetical protein
LPELADAGSRLMSREKAKFSLHSGGEGMVSGGFCGERKGEERSCVLFK